MARVESFYMIYYVFTCDHVSSNKVRLSDEFEKREQSTYLSILTLV